MKLTDVKINELFFDEEYDNQSKSFFASITCFKHIKKIKNIHKIIVEDTIFYCSIGKNAELYVAMRTIDKITLDYLIDYLFNKYDIKTIFIDHLYNMYNSIKYNVIQTGINSDVLMNIPSSLQEYNAMLGKKTRKHLRYYISRLEKQFNNIEYKTFIKDEIEYELIEKMFEYNSIRLSKIKNIDRNYNNSEINNTFNCSKDNGILFVLFINNIPQAISLLENIGGDFYLTDIGSNLEFDSFNIGQINLYKSIEYAINNKEKNDSKYHFMFEITDYKKRFGGRMVELYPYLIYKNKSLNYYYNFVKYKSILEIQKLIKRNDDIKKLINKVRKIFN